jgi:hypothetical protein
MFEIVFVEFNLVHLVPAIVAECAGMIEIRNAALTKVATCGNLTRYMVRGYRL